MGLLRAHLPKHHRSWDASACHELSDFPRSLMLIILCLYAVALGNLFTVQAGALGMGIRLRCRIGWPADSCDIPRSVQLSNAIWKVDRYGTGGGGDAECGARQANYLQATANVTGL